MGFRRVVLTGGPCAGKTTVTELLQNLYGQQVLVTPETATMLFQGGYPQIGRDVHHSPRWIHNFQEAAFWVSTNMEREFIAMAEERTTKVMILDRARLEGAAYLDESEGLPFFLEKFSLNIEEEYGQYDLVIHLESVAVSDPKLYEQLKSTNPSRFENAELAAERDRRIQEVWCKHPNWHKIQSGGGINSVARQVFELISEYLETEIESKFLLNQLPKLDLREGILIRQGYFDTVHEMRIREFGDEHYLTIKGEGGKSRAEYEVRIAKEAFEAMWPDTFGRQIIKLRYIIPYMGHTLELDQYFGNLYGLVTLECEFRSPKDQEAFTLPEWASDAIDVSENPRYKNRALSVLAHLPQ